MNDTKCFVELWNIIESIDNDTLKKRLTETYTDVQTVHNDLLRKHTNTMKEVERLLIEVQNMLEIQEKYKEL